MLIADDSSLIRERLAKLIAHIRKQGLLTRVIVLTNYASEHNRQKSLQLGAETFFDKSTEFAQALDFLESTVPGTDPMKHRAHCLLQFLALGENMITYQGFPDTESYPCMPKLLRKFSTYENPSGRTIFNDQTIRVREVVFARLVKSHEPI